MAQTHSSLHMRSGKTLDVVETIAQILALPTGGTASLPYGVTLTAASGAKPWVALNAIEWIEPT